MDVARLNFSHGDYSDHKAAYERIRSASDATGRAVGVDAGGRVRGITTYERLRAAIQTAEEAGLRDPGQPAFREGRANPAAEAAEAAEAPPAGEGARPS